ncbi:GNAT family N-acetyltransferase [Zavarzinia compransoris]|uniref:GNAT family N-acetyltransferase n=1 Tax=Zavarzinia marina TaxID=2911065 RepID=UPI001F2E4D9C|nr:GNAT family N-acetyltransferase [Zavarzinia marina]MCF4166054.1 GNAT family N-acetyltransferase [Zavarzinia marina]
MAEDALLRARTVEAGDIWACAEIFLDARRRAKPHVPADRFAFEDFSLATADLDLIVAERGGDIVGFAGFDPPANEIDLLFVAPAAQGRGVGALLLAEATRRLRPGAHLRCEASNGAVRAFYRAQGWVELGESWGEVEFIRPNPSLLPFRAILAAPLLVR